MAEIANQFDHAVKGGGLFRIGLFVEETIRNEDPETGDDGEYILRLVCEAAIPALQALVNTNTGFPRGVILGDRFFYDGGFSNPIECDANIKADMSDGKGLVDDVQFDRIYIERLTYAIPSNMVKPFEEKKV